MKRLLTCQCSATWNSTALFVLRLAVGLAFFMHGWQKIAGGVEGVAGFLGSIGFPMATFFAFILMWVEFLGGLALILGVATHLAAKLLGVVMVMALLFVHIGNLGAGLPNGYLVAGGGPELVLVLLAGCLVLMSTGPGKWALMKHNSA